MFKASSSSISLFHSVNLAQNQLIDSYSIYWTPTFNRSQFSLPECVVVCVCAREIFPSSYTKLRELKQYIYFRYFFFSLTLYPFAIFIFAISIRTYLLSVDLPLFFAQSGSGRQGVKSNNKNKNANILQTFYSFAAQWSETNARSMCLSINGKYFSKQYTRTAYTYTSNQYASWNVSHKKREEKNVAQINTHGRKMPIFADINTKATAFTHFSLAFVYQNEHYHPL